MFIDARTVAEGFVAEADVCIVGAGAAGITLGRALLARPLRVVLLESGWLTPDPATQALYTGEVRNMPYFALDSARNRYFGGTTNEWAGECRPLDALDFERREWVADSGWPFDLAHLLPYYARAQDVCQLGRFAYTATDWARDGVRLIPFDGDDVHSTLLHYSPPTRFGAVYRDELAKADGLVVYLGANAVELETPDPPHCVSAVRVACLGGKRFRIKARIVVVATGGIENARLLLLSNRVQSAGLGNAHDVVGRYFMEHLYLDRAATILTRRGAIGDFYTRGHWSDGRRVRGILTLGPELQRREMLTGYCAVVDDPAWLGGIASWRGVLRALRNRRVPTRSVARVRRRLAHVAGAAARRLTRGRWPTQRYLVKDVLEQAPNRESRVVLTGERDALGCRRVALHWSLRAIDKRTAHRAHEVLDAELRRASLGRLRSALGHLHDPWPAGLRGARHHMGTTRMHPDPRRGVVDADGRVHGVANLYVAGSSVFPTCGTANPTLTILALALRLAEHLLRVLATAPTTAASEPHDPARRL